MLADLNKISDGKIYTVNDMARVACKACAGCHACCEQMGESIVLDPLDVWRLCGVTGKSFEELLHREVELHVAEGLILPNLAMTGEREQCAFLNEAGRCSIHANRPGLCRVFPLGRIYEEQGIRYFLQPDACKKAERAKMKISRWLDTPELKMNEQFLVAWHNFRKNAAERVSREQNEQTVKTINMFLLNLFFMTPYDTAQEFYGQFELRMAQAENVLGISRYEPTDNFDI